MDTKLLEDLFAEALEREASPARRMVIEELRADLREPDEEHVVLQAKVEAAKKHWDDWDYAVKDGKVIIEEVGVFEAFLSKAGEVFG